MKKNKIILQCMLLQALNVLLVANINAQQAVQVRDEPRHKPVFENKYVRVLDVWISPGDTTLYHMHTTPSVFNFFTPGILSTQINLGPWETSTPEAGFCWYRSFADDTLVHRIINIDDKAVHVMDVELLSPYGANSSPAIELPFEKLFDNKLVSAFRITQTSEMNQRYHDRGPIVAELVSGDTVVYHNSAMDNPVSFTPGMYLYIAPKSSFYFTGKPNEKINLLLFELK